MNLNTIFRGPATVDPPRLTLVTPPAVEPWLATDPEVQQCLRLDSADDTALVTLNLKAARRYFERITGLCLITQQWQVTFDDLPIRQGQFGIEYGLAPSMSRFTGQAAGRAISFARAPLQTVDAFQYVDENGATQTFNPANYTAGNVGVSTSFGRLWLNEGADWPDVGSYPEGLKIKFTAGFGPAPQTSGALATGATYLINNFVAGDNFTAAGAGANATGVFFTATAMPPGTWTHGSSIMLIDRNNIPEEIRLGLLFLTAHWYENHLPTSSDGPVDMPLHLASLIEMHRVSFIG